MLLRYFPSLLVAILMTMPLHAQNTPLDLPIQVYRIHGVQFTDAQIQQMFERTNSKLQKVAIRVSHKGPVTDVNRPEWAEVNSARVEEILKAHPALGVVRLFLIKKNIEYPHECWTYDPVLDREAPDYWRGAIFISETWADNSDSSYSGRGFPASSDSLLHELGHLLMQKAAHVKHPTLANFFHNEGRLLDDTIWPLQAARMRRSTYLVPNVPIRGLASQEKK